MNQQTGNTGSEDMDALLLLALHRLSLAGPKVFIAIEHYCETMAKGRQIQQ